MVMATLNMNMNKSTDHRGGAAETNIDGIEFTALASAIIGLEPRPAPAVSAMEMPKWQR
jgi:hypothetical protein